MTEIHSFDSIKRTQSQPTTKQNQQYYTKTPQAKPDTVELSTKENNSNKKSIKKYVLAGLAIAGTTLAVVLGLKHMNAKKVLELEEKAKQEAERLRQQAEEAQRQAEEKLKQEAEEAQRRAEELAREEARKAEEKAQARIAQEQAEQKARETEAIKDTEPPQEIQTETVKPEPKVEEPHQEIKQEVEPEITEKPEIKTEEPKNETVIAETEPAETVKTPEKTKVETPEVKEEVKAEPKEEPTVQETKSEAEPVKPEVKVEQPKEEIKPEEIKPETKSEEIQAPKTKPVRPQGLSQAMNTALDFGEDLTDLVNGKNATPEEIQKLVQKHFKNDNIHIHGMSEYDGMGINAKGKAATTRPFFNENGKLEKIDIYVPDLDYGDSNAVMEFISKTTHEMTHVSQFIAKDGSNAELLKPTMEGRCLNYIQKVITDRYTEKLPMDMLKSLFKEEGFVPRTAEDVNKFFDRPNSDLSLEKIGEVTKLGTDEASRKQNVNIIFDVLFDPMMEQMAPRDPNVQSLIRKHGGYEGFKAEMKRICAETFKNEQEAYRAEEMMRQELSGNVGKDTNYGIIHKIMGICADSLG